jgi:hypothetical protein
MSRSTKTQAATTERTAQPPSQSDLSPSDFTSGGDNPTQGEAGASADRPAVKRMAVLSDREAGLRFYFDYQLHRGEISFDDKPTPEVRSFLKQNGFGWDRDAHVWTVPIRFQQREQDRLAAKRTFHKTCELVRAEKGLTEDGPALPD